MPPEPIPASMWMIALESSTPHGGAALFREGEPIALLRLEEGLRHGRELLPAVASLLRDAGLAARDLYAVAVSSGPGSYTGIRVGVMVAKALAYGTGCRLASVSSLAALACSLALEEEARNGEAVLVLQDARRDEVYAGLYRIGENGPEQLLPDAAMTPEEARAVLAGLVAGGEKPRLAGSAFFTYPELFRDWGGEGATPGRVSPEAVGILGHRQLLREISADPLTLQPKYLRRDAGHDWRRDNLIESA